MVNIIFDIKIKGIVKIQLRVGKYIVAEQSLTISQGFDNMLIKALDKLLADNNIDKLLLENVKIAGKINTTAISSMILSTTAIALK